MAMYDEADVRKGRLWVLDKGLWGVRWLPFIGMNNEFEIIPFLNPNTGYYPFITYNEASALNGNGMEVLFVIRNITGAGDYAIAVNPQTIATNQATAIDKAWVDFYKYVANAVQLGSIESITYGTKFRNLLENYYLPPIPKGDLPLSDTDNYLKQLASYATYTKRGPGDIIQPSKFALGTSTQEDNNTI